MNTIYFYRFSCLILGPNTNIFVSSMIFESIFDKSDMYEINIISFTSGVVTNEEMLTLSIGSSITRFLNNGLKKFKNNYKKITFIM